MRTPRSIGGVRGIFLAAGLCALGLGALGTLLIGGAGSASGQGRVAGKVLLFYSAGGVLTDDGTLWQYRPDFGRWMTIDEAFREEGRTTHILPLPVPADQIADMESFGFILTRGGEVWFYEIESDRWKSIGSPGR